MKLRLRPLAALPLALLFVPAGARAEEPGAGLAVALGAGSNLAGFIVGGAILATSHTNAVNSAGWLTIESGFVIAPLAAHGVEGEWGRGALFASVPAACMAGSATLFGVVPNTVDQGSLPQQRLMWGLFVAGQLASVVGIIDASFAPMRRRKIVIVPTVGVGQVGLQIGGVL